jgi:hypothetical protein
MLKQLKMFYYFYETEIANTNKTIVNYTREEDLSDSSNIKYDF